MKLSELLHVASIVVGFSGIISFAGVILSGGDNLIFGITKVDALLCAGILVLIAIWSQLATIHHTMIEKHKEIL